MAGLLSFSIYVKDKGLVNERKNTNFCANLVGLLLSLRPEIEKTAMQALWTVLMLVCSNIFMTFAWYGHLKLQEMKISTGWPLILVILFSWGIAFFEYCLTVPANRIGFVGNGGPFNLMQLKVIQEVISLTVFSIIVLFVFKGQALQWNHLAAFACLVLAVFFVFLK
jgi:uncharacterized protein (DUF486 family)